ncbi:Na+/H+ antiporter NhaC family protein [Leptolyngbya sp. AN02str]|uniref:Na+/H+ antiporter NhaC family protein n=1 Tax=Leptolyngbya sp. AN02str TaxID=3423363 RepID=UPI003D312C1B
MLVTLLLSFGLLLWSALQGVFVAYPLLVSMALFMLVLMRHGFTLRELGRMAIAGGKKSFPVISVLLLIGAVTASWMAAGTVPAIMYYGLQVVHPRSFVPVAFLLSSGVSLLIGTSFGTVGTIGVALMMMASGDGGGMQTHLVAGAIIAGAYVGDRASPMSSSAVLVAIATETHLYRNIRRMWQSSLLPLAATIAIYTVVSWLSPVSLTQSSLLTDIPAEFQVSPLALLPAGIVLVLSLRQIEVKRSMLVSTAVAIALSYFYQHNTLLQIAQFLTLGFRLPESSPLNPILLGGGLLAMLRVSLVVVISTAFVGIFAGTGVLHRIEPVVERAKTKGDRFLGTCIIGTAAAAFGCTQTIAILLTQHIVEKKYEETEPNGDNLALDLENTVVVISPLIPWNIAGLVPATILGTNAGFIPFACYLYLVPLFTLISLRLRPTHQPHLCN